MNPNPWERVPDPVRQALFHEWCEMGLIQFNVHWGFYADLRERGEWNAYATEHLGGRFQVPGETQHV